MKKDFLFFIPALIWLVISTILLTLPGSSFPKEDWLSKIWFDKWVHIGMFAMMTFLWSWAFHKSDKTQPVKSFVVVAIFSLIYGIGMEYVQKYFIVNRAFDIGDIVADAVGSLIGFLFVMKRYLKK